MKRACASRFTVPSVQHAHHIETIGEQSELTSFETFPFEPIVNIFRHRCLSGTRRIDVSNRQSQIDELIAIDAFNRFITERHESISTFRMT